MKMSEQNEFVSAALVSALSGIGNTKHTADNPFFKSKYTPLSDIVTMSREILSDHKLVAIQDISTGDKGVVIKTTILHASGQWVEQEGVEIPVEKMTPQSAGSAITYGRRYTLEAMLGISSQDDDDGNASSVSQKRSVYDTKTLAMEIVATKTVKELESVQHKLSAEKALMTPAQAKMLGKSYTNRMSKLIAENFDGEVTA